MTARELPFYVYELVRVTAPIGLTQSLLLSAVAGDLPRTTVGGLDRALRKLIEHRMIDRSFDGILTLPRGR